MSSEKPDDQKKLSRRNFLKGAGAAVGAVAGIEEGFRIPGMEVVPVQPPALTASLSASPTTIKAGGGVSFV